MKITYTDIGKSVEVEDTPELDEAIEELEWQIEEQTGHHSGSWSGDESEVVYECYQSTPQEVEQALKMWVKELRARGFTVHAAPELGGEAQPPVPDPEMTPPGPLSRPSSLAEREH